MSTRWQRWKTRSCARPLSGLGMGTPPKGSKTSSIGVPLPLQDPLRASARRALPVAPSTPLVNTFLCKVASRCNLDCDYCYMYHHADQSWRDRPRFMSDETVTAFARNLADYVT